MPLKALIFLFILTATFHVSLSGQTIRGEVVDIEDRHPVTGVNIENIYTSFTVTTQENGGFIIAAAQDQLLEFRKTGYKTVRVRVPKGYIPSYFKIIMEHGLNKIEDVEVNQGNRYDYTRDSIKYHELYKHELDFPRLSAFDKIQHPFSAMSRRNREVWKFQDEYSDFEKEKYVDKTFNKELIERFTGLKGDSLNYYIARFRPSFEQLRSMNDYSFFTYIKKTVHTYRHPDMPRGAQ